MLLDAYSYLRRLSFTFQTHNFNLLDPHFSICSIFQLTRCIRESWLNVVLVVCSLDENLLIDLFYKNVSFLTFFYVPYTSGTAIRTSQSTTFFASSSKSVVFYFTNIDSNKLKDMFWNLLMTKSLVEIYSKTCFEKIGAFQSSKA